MLFSNLQNQCLASGYCIKGIGVDILQKSRVKKICLTNKKTLHFTNKILSQQEIDFCKDKFRIDENLHNQNNQNFLSYLAKRFCAKEAVSKALGTGIGESFSFKDCSILNDEKGAPYVKFLGSKILHINEVKPECKVLISISDEKDYCIAFCIVCC